MARARDPSREKAYELYKASNGSIKLKDIALKLGVAAGTVRGWKNKDRWDERLEEESNGTFQTKNNTERSVKSDLKRNNPKPEAVPISTTTVQFEIVPSDGLNSRQLFFCMYYTKYWNATKAYQRAYECDYKTANSNAHRLMLNDGIRRQIEQNKADLANGIMLDARSVLQKYIDIAFADITDFTDFGTIDEVVKDEKGKPVLDYKGEEMTFRRTYVYLRNADEIDGTILTEVKKGKDGVSVKLADKMRALEMLAKYTDLLSENELKQLKIERERIAIRKENNDHYDDEDDENEGDLNW